MNNIKKHNNGFDLLRVASMLYIVGFYHIDDYANDILTNRFTTLLVHIALSVFFFISVYLLHRIIFDILLSIYYPSSHIIIILYLFIVGMPILYIRSYSLQKKYDNLIYSINQKAR